MSGSILVTARYVPNPLPGTLVCSIQPLDGKAPVLCPMLSIQSILMLSNIDRQ